MYSSIPVDPERLERAVASLENRGPDGEGTWWSSDRCIGLGHRRLAVNLNSPGDQPCSGGESERFVVSVNGEFYDLPHPYRHLNDSAALPSLLEAHGWEETLSLLRGEFAFLVYDRLTGELHAVRDRFGIKPLFWARRNQEWWFASKASALWAAGISPGWCERSFQMAATTQYPPPGGSLFEGIRSLEPAQRLTLKNDEVKNQTYWSVPESRDTLLPCPKTFEALLSESVQLRVRAGHPTGVLLSGGVDSASVLALAAQSGADLRAYTIDFPGHTGTEYSEGDLAGKQAAKLGIPWKRLPLHADVILSELPHTIRSTEGLAVNGHAVGKRLLAQAVAADGIKVLLSGEGSDELLFGYRHFHPQPSSDPAGLGILITAEQTPTLPPFYPAFFRPKYQLGKKICAFLNLPWEPNKAFGDLLSENPRGTLEEARQIWLNTALRSYILETLGDGAEMSFSVEGRPPFLDHKLWELACRWSPAALGSKKAILRKVTGPLLLPEIAQKPKHPFMAPPLGTQLFQELQRQITEVPHPFVERDKALTLINTLLNAEQKMRIEWEPPCLWLLSSFHLQSLW